MQLEEHRLRVKRERWVGGIPASNNSLRWILAMPFVENLCLLFVHSLCACTGQRRASSTFSIILHLRPPRQGLTLNLELGWKPVSLGESLTNSAGVYGSVTLPGFLHGFWRFELILV